MCNHKHSTNSDPCPWCLLEHAARVQSKLHTRIGHLEGALRKILATDMGFEWDGTDSPEENAILHARVVLESNV